MMKLESSLLCVLLIITFGTGVASATINITATDITTTSIQWTWNPGLNLTSMLIDGVIICGYETTDNSIIRSGLSSDSLHSINISTTTDYGDNLTMTLPAGNATSGGGSGGGTGIVFGGAGIGLAVIALGLIKRRQNQNQNQ